MSQRMYLKLLGTKLGMTRLFDDQGRMIVCSAIELKPNVVVQVKTVEKDGYQAVQLGGNLVAESKKKNVKAPQKGHFAKAKVEPHKHLFESLVEKSEDYEVGSEIQIDHFTVGEYIDVIGTSKGKGFQGVMKRYNFKGGPAAHGSGFHRHGGSTGMRSTPGRTLEGQKMPGHMGAARVTVEGLKIVKIDKERNVLLVSGSIPGARKGVVYLRKSLKGKK